MDLLQLEQLLSNLSSAGPERQASEELLDSTLANSPAQVLSGLVQIGASASLEVTRILALILLRRLAFRPLPGPSTVDPLSNQVWDAIDEQTRAGIQAGLLAALVGSATKREKERTGICDTIAEIERAGLSRGSTKNFRKRLFYSTDSFLLVTWPALSTTLAALFASPALTLREATFRIYAEVPSLLESETGATVCRTFSWPGLD